MNIDFSPGAAGFREARQVKRIVSYYRTSLHASGDIKRLLDNLDRTVDEHTERNEFRSLRESLPDDRDLTRPIGVSGFVKRLLGKVLKPSPREVELSNQRMEAIDRAERAESVSFDAMAEMTQIQGERDDLIGKLAELEETMKKLTMDLESCKSRNDSGA